MLDSYQPALTYVSLVVAAVGVAGNIAMVRVVFSPRVKKLSVSMFTAVLGLTDSLVLVLVSLDQISHGILSQSPDSHIYGWHDWGCRIGVFLECMCKIMSSWLVVAMVAECYIRKCHPEKKEVVGTWERAFVVNLSVLFISFAGCFPVLVIAISDGKGGCSSRYRTFYKLYVDVILRSITFYLTPVLLLSVCLILTAVQMCKTNSNKAKTFRRSDPRPPKPYDGGPVTKLVMYISGLFLFSCVPFLASETLRHLAVFAPHVINAGKWEIHLTRDILQFLLIFNYAGKFFVGLFVNKHWRTSVMNMCSFGQLGRPYVYKSGSYMDQDMANGMGHVHMNGTTRHTSNPIDETIF